ncbi:MAG: isoaspartyl peptidase/L-asparaginase [Bacteroidota bacterium]
MRNLLTLVVCLAVSCLTFTSCQNIQSQDTSNAKPEYALVIHGGAGTILKKNMTPEREAAYTQALQDALDAGEAVLKAGGSSKDAVIAAIQLMEENPLFNAGVGAVFTHEETVELDASFMDGATLNAGAIAGVKTVKSPIAAARLVMDSSVHVMLSGKGAETFAEGMGLELVENNYFHTDRRLNQIKKIKESQAFVAPGPYQGELSFEGIEDYKFGTVGAAALDKEGNLAAGTSTGGMSNKRFGRIGDAPIIGAGTYANNATCAVSCTGHGEYFIRNVVAYDVSARMQYQGLSLAEAGDGVVMGTLVEEGGSGGLISVDKDGNVHMPFNTSGMYRGYVKSTGESSIGIYKDE